MYHPFLHPQILFMLNFVRVNLLWYCIIAMIHVNIVNFQKNLVLVTEHQFVYYIKCLENFFKDIMFLVSTKFFEKNLNKSIQIFFISFRFG